MSIPRATPLVVETGESPIVFSEIKNRNQRVSLELSAAGQYERQWRVVGEAALRRLDSKRLGRVARLVEGLSGEHNIYRMKGEDIRDAEVTYLIPPPVHLFLARCFVGLLPDYSILEVEEMIIGENLLPNTLLIQGHLIPSLIKGRDEHGSKTEVRGVILLLFSFLAIMPAQLSGVDNIHEVVVSFAPNQVLCSFYDPSTDDFVVDVVK